MSLDRDELLAEAKVNAVKFGTDDAAMKQIIEAADLVFALWKDPADPSGADLALIRGKRRLTATMFSNEPAPPGTIRFERHGHMRLASILCRDGEHASDLQRKFGEVGTYYPKW